MAQCRLPLSFHVVPKLPPRQISPPIRPEEEGGDPPAPELLNLQGLMVDTNAFVSRTPSDGQIHHRPPDFGYIQQDHDHGFFRPPPLPNKNGERTPTLTEVNPDSASITGGVRIWLKGMDFPALFPLFARFGAAIVPTVRVCFYFSTCISSRLLDFLCLQPSCLSFASQNRARRHQCYAIETAPPECTGVWNQHRKI